jgi:hypothetical protein
VRSDGQRDVNQLILTGLTRGTMSPLRRVEAEVRALTERYAVRWIA